jgi:hypothetical protein
LSIEDELLALAKAHEATTETALREMVLARPDLLGRQMRAYLSRQVDYRRIERTNEKILQLTTVQDRLNELACPELELSSGARLEFKMRLEEDQRGWLLKQFRFHVFLPGARSVQMVRIHLNSEAWYDPLTVPRCHMHIGDSHAHVPFPIMHPRLILHLICKHIEPDFGA